MTNKDGLLRRDRTLVAAIVGAVIGAILAGAVTVGVTVYQDRQRERDRREDQLALANERAFEVLTAFETVVGERRANGYDRPPAEFSALTSLGELDHSLATLYLACSPIDPPGEDDPVDLLLLNVYLLRVDIVIAPLEVVGRALDQTRHQVTTFVNFNLDRREG